jgi:hypothetical protein
MPTYIHHLAVNAENYQSFRQVLEEYTREHPHVVTRHAVGSFGHNYLVTATEDIAHFFRDAGIVCSVNQL